MFEGIELSYAFHPPRIEGDIARLSTAPDADRVVGERGKFLQVEIELRYLLH